MKQRTVEYGIKIRAEDGIGNAIKQTDGIL
jgi:hypothetical protein